MLTLDLVKKNCRTKEEWDEFIKTLDLFSVTCSSILWEEILELFEDKDFDLGLKKEANRGSITRIITPVLDEDENDGFCGIRGCNASS